jgi:branched-chain amino acid transport system substrate-binding protein
VSARLFPLLEGHRGTGAPRPYYIFGTQLSDDVRDAIGHDTDLRRRVFGMSNVSTQAPNMNLVLRYNVENPGDEVFPPNAPQPSYDAFYVLAYAIQALGSEPITGPGIARAIERLLPPGKPIDVGPSAIFDGFTTLRSGGRIDLNGAIGSLDFDLATGEAPVEYAILCCAADAHGAATGLVESGLVYDAKAGRLRGTMHCP